MKSDLRSRGRQKVETGLGGCERPSPYFRLTSSYIKANVESRIGFIHTRSHTHLRSVESGLSSGINRAAVLECLDRAEFTSTQANAEECQG